MDKWKIYRNIDVSGAEESSGREGEGRFPQKNKISGENDISEENDVSGGERFQRTGFPEQDEIF